MEQCSRMDEIINKISMFLNEVDKNTMKMVIYKKETIRFRAVSKNDGHSGRYYQKGRKRKWKCEGNNRKIGLFDFTWDSNWCIILNVEI